MSETKQVWILNALLCVVTVWFYYFQIEVGSMVEAYEFNAALIMESPWRLFTAHFFHLNEGHLWANVAGLALLGTLFARFFNVRSYLSDLIVIMIVITGLVWLYGQPQQFIGLSAVVHGLLVLGVLLEWRAKNWQTSEWLLPLILVLVTLKVIAEAFGVLKSQLLLSGQSELTWILHISGIIGGVAAFYLHHRRLKSLATQPTNE